MASAVVSDNFETSTGTIPQLGGADITTRLCSAWVNFNGTGTVAIRDSFNVSSITDIATGKYNVNFTTTLSSADYSPQVSAPSYQAANDAVGARISGHASLVGTPALQTTSSLQVAWGNNISTYYDPNYYYVAIFGN